MSVKHPRNTRETPVKFLDTVFSILHLNFEVEILIERCRTFVEDWPSSRGLIEFMLSRVPPVARAELLTAVPYVALFYVLVLRDDSTPRATQACPTPVDVLENVIHENAPGTGVWGGACRCPNGEMIQVSDNGDFCSTLACVGGTYAACDLRHEGPWSHRRVICAPGLPPAIPIPPPPSPTAPPPSPSPQPPPPPASPTPRYTLGPATLEQPSQGCAAHPPCSTVVRLLESEGLHGRWPALLAVAAFVCGGLSVLLVQALLRCCGKARASDDGAAGLSAGKQTFPQASPRARQLSSGSRCAGRFPQLAQLPPDSGSRKNPRSPLATLALSPSAPEPAALMAQLRAHRPPEVQCAGDGHLTIEGPTAEGGWQSLVYLPSCEALRYEATQTALRPSVRLHCRGVSTALWHALVHCETMDAWQSAVSSLINDAFDQQRIIELA
jgi:hypothetical protein